MSVPIIDLTSDSSPMDETSSPSPAVRIEPLPPTLSNKVSHSQSQSQSSDFVECNESLNDLPTLQPTLSSQWSVGSNESDGDGGWGNLQDEDELQEMAPTIPKEIEKRVRDDVSELRLIKKYQVADPNFGGGTQILLRFGFPVAALGLNVEQCRAWSLDPTALICVDLQLPSHYFNIALKASIGVAVHQTPSLVSPKGSTSDQLNKFKLSWTLESRIKNELIGRLPLNLAPRPYSIDAAYEVSEITGAPFVLAVKALKKTRDNKDSAILLLSNEETAKELLGDDEKTSVSHTVFRNSFLTQSDEGKKRSIKGLFSYLSRASSNLFSSSATTSSSLAQPVSQPISKKKKRGSKGKGTEFESADSDEKHLMNVCGVSSQLARAALTAEPNVDEAALLLTNDVTRQQLESMVVEQKEVAGKIDKDRVGLIHGDAMDLELVEEFSQYNYLVRIAAFLESKLFNLNRYCLLCESLLQYPGLKPSVCGGELCKMGHEELGLGFDLKAELKSNDVLIDLFISFANAAVRMQRMEFITPIGVRVAYVDPKRKDKVEKEFDFLENSGKLSLSKVGATLEKIPAVSIMKDKAATGDLVPHLNSIDPLIVPFIRWLMTSARSHLRLLEPNERIAEIKTPYQFVLLSSSPEQEFKFQELKRKCEKKKGKGNGSIYTWHGSSTANWHSILRIGLKNMSNTKWMTSGAAYGQGIYMATESATSLGYSAQQGGWSRSVLGPNIVALALCEVINDVNPPNPYYVVPEEEKVTTRFIFVFPQSTSPIGQLAISAMSLAGKLPQFDMPEWKGK